MNEPDGGIDEERRERGTDGLEARTGFALTRSVNRDLLADLLSRYDLVDVTDDVPDDGPDLLPMEGDVITMATRETAVYHGRRLGLWLAYLVSQQLDGTVEFTASDPRGSTVTLSVPRGPDPTEDHNGFVSPSAPTR